ncbi:MAG: hypothetical protein KAT05_16300 [Spirochaetes bacterium]|nr:hypothetical protein [Spirochaetota bacterium]
MSDYYTKDEIGAMLASFTSGLWSSAGENIFHTKGNVGIGTAEPNRKLDVLGSTAFHHSSSFMGNTISYTYGDRGYKYLFEKPGYNLLLRSVGIDDTQNPILGADFSRGSVSSPLPVEDGDNLFTILTSGRNKNDTHTPHSALRVLVDGAPDGETVNQKVGLNDNKLMIRSNGNVGIGTTGPNSKLSVVGLPTHANNAAAISGGLTAGDFYRTATGQLMVVY